MRRSTPADFWKYVDRSNPSGCWPWTGATDDHGYGRLRYQGKEWKAHRLAWVLTNGDPGDMFVLHNCDNPPCCKPPDLFLGTQADNMADSARKGRHPKNLNGYLPAGENHHARLRPEIMARGEKNGSAVLTNRQVRAIRQKQKAGWTQRALAKEFGVSKGTIGFIVQRLTWKHVK